MAYGSGVRCRLGGGARLDSYAHDQIAAEAARAAELGAIGAEAKAAVPALDRGPEGPGDRQRVNAQGFRVGKFVGR